jgi:hypothetical protein
MNRYFSHFIVFAVIALTELLLLSKSHKLPCFAFYLCVFILFLSFACAYL